MTLSFLLNFVAQKVPLLGTILTVIGGLRVFFKPLQSFIRFTPTKIDDNLLARFRKTKIYPGIRFFLDLTTSIKTPEPIRKSDTSEVASTK